MVRILEVTQISISIKYKFDPSFDSTKDTLECNSIYIRMIVAMLPAYFRFAQCIRRYRDSKEAFPHLVNAGK
jgi:hypothetical protein